MVLVSSTDRLSPLKSSSGFSATSRDVPELLTRGLDSPDTLLKCQRRLGDEFLSIELIIGASRTRHCHRKVSGWCALDGSSSWS